MLKRRALSVRSSLQIREIILAHSATKLSAERPHTTLKAIRRPELVPRPQRTRTEMVASVQFRKIVMRAGTRSLSQPVRGLPRTEVPSGEQGTRN
jgi:hypothetical protein